MKQHVALSGVLVALGSGLVSLGSLNDPPPFLSGQLVQTVLLVSGIACIAVAMTLLVIAFIRPIRSSHLTCEFARRTDLSDLHEFASAYFPTVSLNQTKALFKLNKKMMWMVSSKRNRFFGIEFGSKLLGYFTVMPLEKSALPLLDDDKWGKEHFTKEYVLKDGSRASVVYIGSIAARRRAKEHTMSRLAFIVGEHRANGASVYTRPVTRRGVDLMDEWGFRPVRESGKDHIYRLDEHEAADFEVERAQRSWERPVRVDEIADRPSINEVEELTGERHKPEGSTSS